MTIKVECDVCGQYLITDSGKMRTYMMVRHAKETGHKTFKKIEYIRVQNIEGAVE